MPTPAVSRKPLRSIGKGAEAGPRQLTPATMLFDSWGILGIFPKIRDSFIA